MFLNIVITFEHLNKKKTDIILHTQTEKALNFEPDLDLAINQDCKLDSLECNTNNSQENMKLLWISRLK